MIFQPILLETNEDKDDVIKKAVTVSGVEVALTSIQTLETPEKKQSIGVKDIAVLQQWIGFKSENPRMFIVLQADALTREAQNSLLKVLEEPTANSLIVLVTPNKDLLLETILSRTLLVGEQVRKEIDNLANIFTDSKDYIERKKVAKDVLKAPNAARVVEDICYEILKQIKNGTLIGTPDAVVDMIKLLETSIKAMKRSVAKALVLDTIIVHLEKLEKK
jgi:hypothetical protein